MVSDKKSFSHFPTLANVEHVTPGAGPFSPCKAYNLNKLGRGPLGDGTYQISISLGLLVSDKKIFSRFPNINLCKTIDPQSWTIFGPRAINLTNMVEVD